MNSIKESQQNTIESFFKEPSVKYIFTARKARHRAVVVSNQSGNYQLYAVDFNSGSKRQVTDSPQGTLFGSISANGEFIYIFDSSDESKYGHFKRTPFAEGEEENITPQYDNYFSYTVSDSNDGNVAGLRITADKQNKILATKRENGSYQAQELYTTENSLSEAVCSPDGEIICTAETVAEEEKRLVFLYPKEDSKIEYSDYFQEIKPLAFSPSNSKQLFGLTQQKGWQRPFFYNLTTKNLEILDHSVFNGDVWVLNWDEAKQQMILCDVYRGQQTLYLYNSKKGDIRQIGPKTGSFNFHFGSAATRKNGSVIVRWSDFNTSPQLIAIQIDEPGKWSKLPEWSGNISTNYDVESIQAKSSDEETIQAWVARPKNTSEPIPFVIDVHGGPHGVALDEFSSKAQAWLQNGFGYCAVNYRGSISFGKDFKEKIYGNPGYRETEDVVAARNWLVDNEYAKPDEITLYGWSWGGYITLLALGKYPELWNAGIAGSAITDCIMQYEDEPAYFQAEDKKRFNGTPETNREQYVRSSPITYAKKFQAPTLLIHGENDVRCPPRQIKSFVKKLENNEKNISIEWFDSGHTGEFTNTKLRTEMIKKATKFAENVNKS